MAKRIQQERPATEAMHAPVSTDTEVVLPEMGGRKPYEAPPPQIGDSPAFLYKHRPTDWTVMNGTVVPRLTKLKLQPGVNGVDQDRAGRPIANHIIAELRESGVRVIPWDVEGPGTSYLRRPNGSPAVISRWERVYPGSSQIDCDEKGYVAFCRKLMADGVVGQPPIYILERMESVVLRQVEDLDGKPGLGTMTASLRRELDGIRAELAAQRANAPASETETFTAEVG